MSLELLNSPERPLPAFAISADSAYLTLARLESALAEVTGKKAHSAPQVARDRFAALPASLRNKIVEGWIGQAEFTEDVIRLGINAFNESEMLSYALGRLDLSGGQGCFTDIRPGEVVEICDEDYVQVYRSYSYFSLCNYSLLELSVYPWFELYERCSTVTRRLLDVINPVLQGRVDRASFEHIEEHTLRELLTDEPAIFALQERVAYRLGSNVSGRNYALTMKTVRELPSDSASSVRSLHFL